MFVIAYNPETSEQFMTRRMGINEKMDEDVIAARIAASVGASLDTSGGYIPNCCGDLRIEFRPSLKNETHIWGGKNFFFKRD